MPSYYNVIISGFGGQGVLLIGSLLAYAAMDEGKHVTYFPVYGAEMRGGSAYCTIVISEAPVASPVIKSPLSTIIMNQLSLDRFQSSLYKDGVQIVNSSLVKERIDPEVKTVSVPADTLADTMNNSRGANMVALGVFLNATKCLPFEAVVKALDKVIPKHNSKLIPKNIEALEAGYSYR